MPEQLYEGMFVLDSGKFTADPDGVTSKVVGILEKAGAVVVAHRPWQDGRLAYEIEGHRKGLHFLTYFKMGTSAHPEVIRACRLSDVVLRHLFIKHPKSLFDAMVTALSSHESAAASDRPSEPAAAKGEKEEVVSEESPQAAQSTSE